MKEQWKVITTIIVLILVVVFALQNTAGVTVDLFFVNFQVPLVLVILFSLLVGVIIGLMTSMAAIRANHKDNSSLTKELDKIKLSHQEALNEKEGLIRQLRQEIEQQQHVSHYRPEESDKEASPQFGLTAKPEEAKKLSNETAEVEAVEEATEE